MHTYTLYAYQGCMFYALIYQMDSVVGFTSGVSACARAQYSTHTGSVGVIPNLIADLLEAVSV